MHSCYLDTEFLTCWEGFFRETLSCGLDWKYGVYSSGPAEGLRINNRVDRIGSLEGLVWQRQRTSMAIGVFGDVPTWRVVSGMYAGVLLNGVGRKSCFFSPLSCAGSRGIRPGWKLQWFS